VRSCVRARASQKKRIRYEKRIVSRAARGDCRLPEASTYHSHWPAPQFPANRLARRSSRFLRLLEASRFISSAASCRNTAQSRIPRSSSLAVPSSFDVSMREREAGVIPNSSSIAFICSIALFAIGRYGDCIRIACLVSAGPCRIRGSACTPRPIANRPRNRSRVRSCRFSKAD